METITYYLPIIASIRDFFILGGDILIIISLLTLLMWTLIIERLFYFRNNHNKNVNSAVYLWENRSERKSWHAQQMRSRLISMVSQEVQRHLNLIRSCVALCPLLGLLGTVTGMIDVFEVMALSGTGNARSMADGVSRATVPTMAGMVAALSGVAMSAYLQKTAYRERLLIAEHMTMDH